MTFAFALLTGGFLLLRAGWEGTTPVQVLRSLSTGGGPGGPLSELGSGVKSSFTGKASEDIGKIPGKPTSGSQKKLETQIAKSNPDLQPGVRTVAAVVMGLFPNLTISSGVRPGDDGHHGEGRAVDLSGSKQEMDKAAKFIKKYLTQTLTEGIYNPILSVQSKKRVPASFWGAGTWNDHRDHIHLAV